jgi:excisionase family DNA binding protein
MSKNNQKVQIFSALEVANICGVVNQTAINWIRSGHLKAFTTPGGQYRVYAEDLSDFLDKRGMRNSVDVLHIKTDDTARETALIIDHDWDMNNSLKTWLQKNFPVYEVLQAFDSFDAGHRMAVSKPGIVFLNTDIPGINGFELAKRIKKGTYGWGSKGNISPGKPLVITLTNNDTAGTDKNTAWTDACFPRQLDLNQLRGIIEDLEKRSRMAVTA